MTIPDPDLRLRILARVAVMMAIFLALGLLALIAFARSRRGLGLRHPWASGAVVGGTWLRLAPSLHSADR
jgi:hypothetical protein